MNDGHGTTIREAMKKSMEKPACHPGCTRKQTEETGWVDWLGWFIIVGAMFSAVWGILKLLDK